MLAVVEFLRENEDLRGAIMGYNDHAILVGDNNVVG
jgi:hypothetical protein